MHGLGVVEDGSWWMEERKANVRRGFVTGGEEKDGCWSGLVWFGWELGARCRGTLPTQKAGKRYKIYSVPLKDPGSCCDRLAGAGSGPADVCCLLAELPLRCWARLSVAFASDRPPAGCAGPTDSKQAAYETTLQRAPAAILLPLAPEEHSHCCPYREEVPCVCTRTKLPPNSFPGCCPAPPGTSLSSTATHREPGWPA